MITLIWYFNTNTMTGLIVDKSGNPLPYVGISEENYFFGKLIQETPITRSNKNGEFTIENLRWGELHLKFSYLIEKEKNTYSLDLAREYGTVYFHDIKDWKLIINLDKAFENSFDEIKNDKEIVVFLPEGKRYITVR